MANKGYEGKIKNSGTQFVQAPLAPGGKKGKGTVTTGDDLRKGK